jgi:hypothetical protein
MKNWSIAGNGRAGHGRAHLPEIIRRRFNGDLFNRVRNPARRLVAHLAETAKGEVVAPVAKVVAGFFGVHKRRVTLPVISKRRFYSESECGRTASGRHRWRSSEPPFWRKNKKSPESK